MMTTGTANIRLHLSGLTICDEVESGVVPRTAPMRHIEIQLRKVPSVALRTPMKAIGSRGKRTKSMFVYADHGWTAEFSTATMPVPPNWKAARAEMNWAHAGIVASTLKTLL